MQNFETYPDVFSLIFVTCVKETIARVGRANLFSCEGNSTAGPQQQQERQQKREH